MGLSDGTRTFREQTMDQNKSLELQLPSFLKGSAPFYGLISLRDLLSAWCWHNDTANIDSSTYFIRKEAVSYLKHPHELSLFLFYIISPNGSDSSRSFSPFILLGFKMASDMLKSIIWKYFRKNMISIILLNILTFFKK